MKSLVVEDDFTSRVLLQELLKSHGSVHIAVNGEEALTAIRAAYENEEPYDLICLDIMMPVMDGATTLRKLREFESSVGIEGLDGMKVIMTTALGDSKNVIQSFRDQCDGYLVKPIRGDKLLELLTTNNLVSPS